MAGRRTGQRTAVRRVVVQGEEPGVALRHGLQLEDGVVEGERESGGHGQQRLLLLGHHDADRRV